MTLRTQQRETRQAKMSLKAAVLVVAFCTTVTTVSAAPTVNKSETFSDWSLYVDDATPHQFCFVTSEPKSSEPAGASRDDPRLYISAWPKDGIKSEVSFRMGFPVKSNGDGKATVSPASFAVFGANDRAYVADAIQELKLVDAMKKGSKLEVAVTSERGTRVTDSYSLSGLGQALQKLQDTCF